MQALSFHQLRHQVKFFLSFVVVTAAPEEEFIGDDTGVEEGGWDHEFFEELAEYGGF